ncbi:MULTISPECIES: winged helix-turn-helix transcriptional regulator [Carnobacterium]|jgi:DNA-binding HxlR family transcriptional regulator|uniref:HxlR-like helix-turn-helix family protein n=1 Tax=Carnobacterium maltaromaticum LMA28 TaxID=1234679 RepID=K8E6Q0_CARML|nr:MULTISPECIES: helix-turn-helix domain-containing protein [Carnobacterium]AOA03092.1 HxlR family transcriptional regulator [Carnobacterium maltaromaticum]MBC9789857.1 transcriptional regulator [Carnobacterium maltaromaticum]MBC9809399.1 transcriptional regulator [Carnobacterium maltaromaticum]MBQ6485731.1 helix-turn-helix transcriptional regulator [Carnobacterium sp.]MCC4311463.1 HxlR family transcriptional regulator [Carnobacterium maltaromaticum]
MNEELMDKATSQKCTQVEHVFSILDKKWMGLIVEVLLEGPQRYKDIAAKIPTISDRILVERLKELADNDILVRDVYPDSQVRVEYSLTEKGYSLKNVMSEVHIWADKWMD